MGEFSPFFRVDFNKRKIKLKKEEKKKRESEFKCLLEIAV